MKTATKIGLGAVATMMAVSAIGGTSMHLSAAVAGDADDAAAAKRARKDAKAAQAAIGGRAFPRAIAHAEAAVAMVPRDAGYRALLGQAYLGGGRFLSAAQALDEALALDPSNGRVALNLALARIAMGEWESARATLAAHAGHIAVADHGLALALAGDPVAAVQLLGQAARDPAADAKVRQNLALSLALAGRWMEAKTVAEIDLPAAQVQQRILQWAAFARPVAASDQVAALMGIVPVADGGRPAQLALTAPAVQLAAVPEPVPQPVAVPEAFGAGAIAPSRTTSIAVPAPATAPAGTASLPAMRRIVFAERREIVQALPAVYRTPVRVATTGRRKAGAAAPVRAAAPARGGYYVQLGAYRNAGLAREAWSRMSRRVDALGAMTPQGTMVSLNDQRFYRLSVGGFGRGDADRVCRSVRADGGTCFVRAQAGDKLAAWAGGTRLAMR